MQKINVLLANSEDPAVLVEEVALVSNTLKKIMIWSCALALGVS